jgi:hypothetical protein
MHFHPYDVLTILENSLALTNSTKSREIGCLATGTFDQTQQHATADSSHSLEPCNCRIKCPVTLQRAASLRGSHPTTRHP